MSRVVSEKLGAVKSTLYGGVSSVPELVRYLGSVH